MVFFESRKIFYPKTSFESKLSSKGSCTFNLFLLYVDTSTHQHSHQHINTTRHQHSNTTHQYNTSPLCRFAAFLTGSCYLLLNWEMLSQAHKKVEFPLTLNFPELLPVALLIGNFDQSFNRVKEL
jgi:hypothetical protein